MFEVRRKTFLAFEERHSFCSKKDIPCDGGRRNANFGRTDLKKGVSEAKFDGQADFHVQKIPAPSKSAENHEKPKKNREKNFAKKFVFRFVFFDLESFKTRFGNVSQVKKPRKTSKNVEKFAKNSRKFAFISEVIRKVIVADSAAISEVLKLDGTTSC